jgi:hypothetical protein
MTFEYTTSAEEDLALAELVAASKIPTTVETYFQERTAHWMQHLVAERQARVKQLVATVYEQVLVAGTPEEKAFLAAMSQKYAGL